MIKYQKNANVQSSDMHFDNILNLHLIFSQNQFNTEKEF